MDKTTQTEQKILQAAMDIFVRKGRYGAKMQEIADEAGINKALLHYYFRSKDKLYTKVFEDVFVSEFGALHEIFEIDADFKTKLINFIDQYTNLILKNPHFPIFILRELSEGAEDVKPVFNRILSNNQFNLPHSFIQAIQLAIRNGEIKPVDPRHLFITIIGAVVFYFIAEPLLSEFLKNDRNFNRIKFVEERKKFIVDIIFNGIKP